MRRDSELQANGYRLRAVFRGVSSTVKLSVSKTELGGSNPSAPARFGIPGVKPDAKELQYGIEGIPYERRTAERVSEFRWRHQRHLGQAHALSERCARGDEEGRVPQPQGSRVDNLGGDYHDVSFRAVFLRSRRHFQPGRGTDPA